MSDLVLHLVLFAAAGSLMVGAPMVLGRWLRPNRPTPEKDAIYECGEPTIGSSFIQFDLRFYTVALLFIVFDVEVAFFFPWATVYGTTVQLTDTRLDQGARQQLTEKLFNEKPGSHALVTLSDGTLTAVEKSAVDAESDKKDAPWKFAAGHQVKLTFSAPVSAIVAETAFEDSLAELKGRDGKAKYSQTARLVQLSEGATVSTSAPQAAYTFESDKTVASDDLNAVVANLKSKPVNVISAKTALRFGWLAFADILVFFSVLLVGFAYVWKRGDLEWVKAMPTNRRKDLAENAPAGQPELVH